MPRSIPWVALALLLATLIAGCGGNGGVSVQPNPFAGTYVGTYSGSESGSIEATVATSGRLSGQAQSPTCGLMPVTGTVKPTGDVSASARCGQWTISYTGLFTESGGVKSGSGTWRSSSGYSGTWSVHEAPP
jgi:hypothetical protein